MKNSTILVVGTLGLVGAYLYLKGKKEPMLERPFKVPFYPIAPIIALVIAISSFIAMAIFNPLLAGIYIVLILTSYALYKVFNQSK